MLLLLLLHHPCRSARSGGCGMVDRAGIVATCIRIRRNCGRTRGGGRGQRVTTVLRGVLIVLWLSSADRAPSAAVVRCRRGLEVVGLAPLDKQIDQNRPCPFAVVVGHVVVYLGGKVQKQVPSVARNRSLVVLLEKEEERIRRGRSDKVTRNSPSGTGTTDRGT